MKKWFVTFCMVGIAAIPGFSQQAATGVEENIRKAKDRLGDQLLTNADAVIARYMEAIGGAEAIASIKTLMIKGRNARFGRDETYHLRFYQQPDRFRAMRRLDDTAYTLVADGKTWSVGPAGRRELTEWWAKTLAHERIDGNFLHYAERGIKYEYIGLEGFESEPHVYYHLRRTFPDGVIEDLYFDTATGLLHGIWPSSSPRKDSPMFFYEYRKTGGVLFPYIWMRVHGKTAPPHLFIVEEIKINEEFGEGFFK